MEHPIFIESLAEMYKPAVYLELGVDAGATLFPVAKHAKKVYGVDIKVRSDTREAAKSISNITLVESSTDEFFKLFQQKVDMVFIDADHSAASALRDLNNSLKLLNDDGLIIMHDTNPCDDIYKTPSYCGDCYKLIPELEKRNDINIVTLPLHIAGLSIVQKKNNN